MCRAGGHLCRISFLLGLELFLRTNHIPGQEEPASGRIKIAPLDSQEIGSLEQDKHLLNNLSDSKPDL